MSSPRGLLDSPRDSTPHGTRHHHLLLLTGLTGPISVNISRVPLSCICQKMTWLCLIAFQPQEEWLLWSPSISYNCFICALPYHYKVKHNHGRFIMTKFDEPVLSSPSTLTILLRCSTCTKSQSAVIVQPSHKAASMLGDYSSKNAILEYHSPVRGKNRHLQIGQALFNSDSQASKSRLKENRYRV